MQRRDFLVRGGLAIGAAATAAVPLAKPAQALQAPSAGDGAIDSDWEAVRAQFNLDPDLIHMGGFYLASHPTPVREAIERHRRGLDINPIGYHHEHRRELEQAVHDAAGMYLGVDGGDVALTDSTTMGLATLYNGLRLEPGQEILTTEHDHYATWRSLELKAERSGAKVRTIPLYEYGKSNAVTADGIVAALTKAISPETRVVAVTWAHSVTGVKIPVRAMADEIAQMNKTRDEANRIIFCVDGVHALGIEDVSLPDLGCDFLCAGTHKWMFGPRGTGIVWGRPESQHLVNPTIPAFGLGMRRGARRDDRRIAWGEAMSPGGFHSFEHRWALTQAFDFHMAIGKQRVAQRTHTLNRQLKEGMAGMKHITLHTPMSDDLSAGIVCFEAAGKSVEETIDRLGEKKILGSVSPYTPSYARLAPSLLVSSEQVETTLKALRGSA